MMAGTGMSKREAGLTRRSFLLGSTAVATSAVSLGRVAPSDTLAVGVMGVNSRGHELALVFARSGGARVTCIADVDRRAVERTVAAVAETGAEKPKGVGDFRTILEDPAVDALVIAACDHWHTPAAVLALQAGKHVYVEKPASHNAAEGELLVRAQRRYGGLVQMGNQQRSFPPSRQVIQMIHEGIIGNPYYGRAWYANTRGSIGRGKEATPPAWLDYELWQGPAPRTPYRDNVVHYNWHWFWRWGTGEICNNGTHEIDVCRWALGVDAPRKVNSAGGRYHFDDDWEAFDTQIASFDFEGGRTIAWEGRSCNGRTINGRSRGASIHGEKGTVFLDRNGWVIYDTDDREVRRSSSGDSGRNFTLTDHHVDNFLQSVRGRARLNAPIHQGQASVLLCHLGNIAQRVGRSLTFDPDRGRIAGDAEAMRLWGREYQPGWEPRLL